eukprot:366229-Chlamydomonas_euryale.AAC.39
MLSLHAALKWLSIGLCKNQCSACIGSGIERQVSMCGMLFCFLGCMVYVMSNNTPQANTHGKPNTFKPCLGALMDLLRFSAAWCAASRARAADIVLHANLHACDECLLAGQLPGLVVDKDKQQALDKFPSLTTDATPVGAYLKETCERRADLHATSDAAGRPPCPRASLSKQTRVRPCCTGSRDIQWAGTLSVPSQLDFHGPKRSRAVGKTVPTQGQT